MKLRYITIIAIIATVIFSLTNQETAHSNASTPPTGRTGAPSESTCAASGCHTGSAVVTNSSTIVFATQGATNFATGYTSGTVYNISITFNANTSTKGFEMVALDAANNSAGTFAFSNGTSSSTVSLQTAGGRQYVGHKNASSFSAWAFKWTAPATTTGPVTFYVAANAANGNNNESGDVIHTDTFMVYPAGTVACNLNAAISGNTSFCSGGSTTLTASSTGGTGTNAYLWSDHSSNSTLTVSTAGTYGVTVTNNGCTATASVIVTGGVAAVANFTVSVDSLGAHIENTSTGNITGGTWNFGDGNTAPVTSNSFTHAYATSGTYTISLSGTDGCNSAAVTHDTTITVTASHVGIANVSQHAVSIYPNPITDNFTITVDGNSEEFQLNVYNLAGKIVRSVNGTTGSALSMNREGLSKGIYIYRIALGSKTLSGKLIVE